MGHTNQNDHSLLLFRVAGVACSVLALEVDSIVLPPAHITSIPGTNKTMPGIFHHASGTVAIIDLFKKFSGPHATPSKTTGRLLLSHLGQSLYGFYVDEVIGIIQPDQAKAAALPPNLPHNTFTSALFYHSEIILYSDFARLYAMPQSGALLDYHASHTRVQTDTIVSKPVTPAIDTVPSIMSQENKPSETPPLIKKEARIPPSTKQLPVTPAHKPIISGRKTTTTEAPATTDKKTPASSAISTPTSPAVNIHLKNSTGSKSERTRMSASVYSQQKQKRSHSLI
ncbi:MAG: chemotaxis protein CheW [Gammaproteobacteria bacterium]|nr:chemotaxis protein CheW [Gammaproteobacteria bacterium]